MFYQQGTQRIEVIVRKEGGAGSAGAKEKPAESAGEETASAGEDFDRDAARLHRIVVTNTTHTLAVVMHGTSMALNYVIGGLGMRFGDEAYQETVSREVEIAKDVIGIGSSFAMGAVYGAWGGPTGAIIGSLLNGARTIVSTAFKYGERRRDFNYKVFKQENSIEYTRARASISLTTGRLR